MSVRVKQIKKTRTRLYRRVTLTQGEKDGGPVLRGEGSWRKWNGILFSTDRWGTWYVGFRRHGLWLKAR